MLKTTMVRQPSEEDPDEGIKDLVETMIKRMVSKKTSLLVSRLSSVYYCCRILIMTLKFLWKTT